MLQLEALGPMMPGPSRTDRAPLCVACYYIRFAIRARVLVMRGRYPEEIRDSVENSITTGLTNCEYWVCKIIVERLMKTGEARDLTSTAIVWAV